MNPMNSQATTDNQAIEVFWMEQDTYGVVWPYEMARYGGQWPVDFDSNALTRRIYATHATYSLCGLLLLDSAHIQEKDVRFVNKIHSFHCDDMPTPAMSAKNPATPTRTSP